MKTVVSLLVGTLLGALAITCIPTTAQEAPAKSPPAQTSRDHRDKAWIGISHITDQWGALEITLVHMGSPAWEAGLMVGDTIIGVEILVKGEPQKEMTHGHTVPYFLAGLNTAAPGTEFKVYVKRGQQSLSAEKAFAVDFPREGIEIPAAAVVIEHVQRKSADWKQAEFVWMNIKSRSYNEFSEHAMRTQQMEVARLQILKLQEEARNADLKRVQLIVDIENAIAQRDLALAQIKTNELKKIEGGFSIIKLALGIFGLLF